MKKLILSTILLGCCFGFALPAQAQENYTEGPVWVINYYRTRPGKFDEYMKFLRANFAKTAAKQKSAGIVVDTKVLINPSISGPEDWDVGIAYLYSDFGRLNYNQSTEDQLQKIAEEITGDKNKERRDTKLDTTRFPLRDYLRTRIVREVMLKP
jgi:hypothetical protein